MNRNVAFAMTYLMFVAIHINVYIILRTLFDVNPYSYVVFVAVSHLAADSERVTDEQTAFTGTVHPLWYFLVHVCGVVGLFLAFHAAFGPPLAV